MASGRICFVLSRAKQSSISSALDPRAGSTNIKCDTGNTEDSLCDRVQLEGINLSPVSIWED